MSLEFNRVQTQKPRRNYFDLSHDRKFSFNMGKLIPIMTQEVLPGDKWSVKNEQLLRFAPMLAPIMHKVDVYTHYFFVPNRILWNNWEEFITGNQGEAPAPAFPYFKIDGSPDFPRSFCNKGSIGDYLGLPTDSFTSSAPNTDFKYSCLPLAAYIKIFNEYYRDQNLQDEIKCELVDGENGTFGNPNIGFLPQYDPLNRAWEHDYFTSCLPWTQKGEEVFLTFETESALPVEWNQAGSPTIIRESDGTPIPNPPSGWSPNDIIAGNDGVAMYQTTDGIDTNQGQAWFDNSESLEVDLSGSYLMTVNELRKAMAIQRWLELNARGGSRYIETILAHFGVRSSDARLQRPEYLGGGKSAVSVSEVLQMSQSDTTPQGTMSGHGINYGTSHEFSKYFEEHGYIIGIMSVMPKTAYQQGLPKHFQKFDKLDYFWHSFAHLGEQEVKNSEIYIGSANPNDAFGYVPRYSEYKFINSSVHGDFRGNLDFWHLGRIFDSEPALNSDFIKCQPSTRIFAVTEEANHHLWCHLYQKVSAVRPIPIFSTPSII